MNSHWLKTTLITIPSASVASASRFSRRRSATKLSAYATSAASDRAGDHPEPRRDVPAFTASAADVYAPIAEERRLPERDLAGVPHEQVQPDRDQRVQPDQRQQPRVVRRQEPDERGDERQQHEPDRTVAGRRSAETSKQRPIPSAIACNPCRALATRQACATFDRERRAGDHRLILACRVLGPARRLVDGVRARRERPVLRASCRS